MTTAPNVHDVQYINLLYLLALQKCINEDPVRAVVSTASLLRKRSRSRGYRSMPFTPSPVASMNASPRFG